MQIKTVIKYIYIYIYCSSSSQRSKNLITMLVSFEVKALLLLTSRVQVNTSMKDNWTIYQNLKSNMLEICSPFKLKEWTQRHVDYSEKWDFNAPLQDWMPD
jgi:IS1 family transposase